MATPAHSPQRRPRNRAAAAPSPADPLPPADPAYPGDPALEALASRGIRCNQGRYFHLELSGLEFYKLRTMIESRTLDAAKAENFADAREAVLLWEKVTTQAKAQGF